MTQKVKKSGLHSNRVQNRKKLKNRNVNRKTHVLFSEEETVLSTPFTEGNQRDILKPTKFLVNDPAKELSIPHSVAHIKKSIHFVETDSERSWSSFRQRMRQKGYNF